MRHGAVLRTTKVPMLLVSGWQDSSTARTTMDQFRQLRERGGPVGLTVGPWHHMQAAGGEAVPREAYDWLESYYYYYLAGRATSSSSKPGRRPDPVRFHVTGADEWWWVPSWPPHAPRGHSRFTSIPTANSPKRRPLFGGPLLLGGGSVDDAVLATRADVLAFSTPPLAHDVEVLGKPHVKLTHSSDNPHDDVFVRLCEVGGKGVSRNLTLVCQRLDPGRAPHGPTVKVDLDWADCAHHFKKGTSIRLACCWGRLPTLSFQTWARVRIRSRVVHFVRQRIYDSHWRKRRVENCSFYLADIVAMPSFFPHPHFGFLGVHDFSAWELKKEIGSGTDTWQKSHMSFSIRTERGFEAPLIGIVSFRVAIVAQQIRAIHVLDGIRHCITSHQGRCSGVDRSLPKVASAVPISPGYSQLQLVSPCQYVGRGTHVVLVAPSTRPIC